jgi:death-on-curing family protein
MTRRITRITVKEVEYTAFSLAKELMTWNEPIPDFGTRFPNVLESCLNAPFATFNHKPLYRRLNGKAAALFYFLVKNHPFENGNKRIAVMSVLVFLAKNGKWLSVSNENLYEVTLAPAQSDVRGKDSQMQFLQEFFKEFVVDL